MASHRLAESTVKLIRDYLKANLDTALATVRTDRGDAAVTMGPVKKYFLYAPAKGYEVPAVFIICPEIELRNAEKGANFICALAHVVVSVVVEDRIRDNLVIKTWRYQAALHKLLHETTLQSTDSTVRLVSKVERLHFGPEFTEKDPASPDAVFRKEVALKLEVEHYENL